MFAKWPNRQLSSTNSYLINRLYFFRIPFIFNACFKTWKPRQAPKRFNTKSSISQWSHIKNNWNNSMPIIMETITNVYFLKLHSLTFGNKQSRKNPAGTNRIIFSITFLHHVMSVYPWISKRKRNGIKLESIGQVLNG